MTEERAPIYSALADDEELRDIIVMFVEEMPERAEQLRRCFDAKDWEAMRVAAHRLKGSAGSHGFAELTTQAAALEEAVRTNRPEDQIAEALRQLVDACGRATAKPRPS